MKRSLISIYYIKTVIMIEANKLIFPHPKYPQHQHTHQLIKNNIVYIPKQINPPEGCFCQTEKPHYNENQSNKTTARTYDSSQNTQTIKIKISNQMKMKMVLRKKKRISTINVRQEIEMPSQAAEPQKNPILTPRTLLFHPESSNQDQINMDKNRSAKKSRSIFYSDQLFQPEEQDEYFQNQPIKVAKFEINKKGSLYNRPKTSELWDYKQGQDLMSNTASIPCLYIEGSKFQDKIIVYFHGNGEDIVGCYSFLKGLCNEIKYSVLAVEYPGYSMYKGDCSAWSIEKDSIEVIQFLKCKIGFKEKDIVIMGRSIGSGPATFVSSIFQVGGLILLSPFLSLCEAVGDLYGALVSGILTQRFDNKMIAKKINSACLIVHGSKDKLISQKHTTELSQYFKGYCSTKIIKNMSHTSFNHEQFFQCVKGFLESIGF